MAGASDTPSSHADGTHATHRSELPDAATGRIARRIRPLVAFASGPPFVAAIAAVEVAIATVLLGLPLTPAPAVVALVAFAVYAVDHVADAGADAHSMPERAAIAHRYADQLMIAAALAYGIAVALSIVGGPLALGVTLLPGAFWVLYASNWLPNAGRLASAVASNGRTDVLWRRIPRLKDVVVLNSAVVALAWAIAVTALPLAFAGADGGAFADAGTVADAGALADAEAGRVAVVFAYFFLRSFVDVELPNVRDVDADAAVGVATLPLVLGVDRTRRVLYGVDLLTSVVLAAAAVAGLLAWPLVAALGAGIAVSLGVTALAGRVDDASVLGIAPDCSYLVVGMIVAGWLAG
ncbi:UbiA family prenyltransferase [Halorubrum sp. AD140]|uniref:UbiA family prenyltransferase n=1 Tax=Halorubrum sp. AD140 TaxID=3050073 RepID=UPI002ACCCDD7|nr:UbiA family prenyltransferase [Halorubrum sp. AD140]MDZ5810984.1 UbiA family prenyltransferase [Halorubrum sp. AD140]